VLLTAAATCTKPQSTRWIRVLGLGLGFRAQAAAEKHSPELGTSEPQLQRGEPCKAEPSAAASAATGASASLAFCASPGTCGDMLAPSVQSKREALGL